MNLKGSKTEMNLFKTFAGESRARNKYNLYAEKARKEGYKYIESIFNATAKMKRHMQEKYSEDISA